MDKKMVTCPKCQGKGYVLVTEYREPNGDADDFGTEPCRTCKGKGVIPEDTK